MSEPNVVGAPTANRHLRFGINAIADLLAPTFGPIGGLVVNQTELGRPELLDDSATIVRRIIDLGSPERNIGTMLMRNLVWRVGQQVGDGGAMAALLARAIYNDAWRLVTAGANPVMIAQGVDQAVPRVLAALDRQSLPLATEDELAAFALTLTQDRPLAAVLAEMSYLLGPDAHVVVEGYAGTFLERQYVAGARYPGQIASAYLYTDPAHKRAVVADALLAIVDQDLNEPDEIVPLLEAAAQAGKNLAILATGVSDAALGVLIANVKAARQGEAQDRPSVLAAKLTTLGEEHRLALSDLALLTGAHVLGRNYERAPARAQPDDLGRARRVEATSEAVIVETDAHARPAIQDEAQRLRRYLAGLPLKADERPLLIKRLSTLSGGVGELKIGAISKTELETRRTRAERAFKVLSAAQRGGVVAGGGAALVHSLAALQDKLPGDAGLGVQILARALPVPLRQLVGNAHVDRPEWIMENVRQAGPPAAFDVLNGRVVDARQTGILDATQVIKAVFQIAVSGAMMALKTDTIVYHRKPKENEGLEP